MKTTPLTERTLTVIIRNDGPLVCANSSPTFRSVRLALTEEQAKSLDLRFTHSSGGDEFYESIAQCFLERGEEE